jgi:hypothetical protein
MKLKTLSRFALFAWVFILSLGLSCANQDTPSNDPLTIDLLAKFKENSLANGTGGKSQVRITLLRSFHPPLMIKWYPEADADEVAVQAKTLTKNLEPEGVRLSKDVTARLSVGQRENLKQYFGLADPVNLPKEDWRSSDVLDGSTWVIEIASDEEVTRLVRRNPMSLPSESSDRNKVTHDRIWREQFLVTFALNLLMASGLEVDELY